MNSLQLVGEIEYVSFSLVIMLAQICLVYRIKSVNILGILGKIVMPLKNKHVTYLCLVYCHKLRTCYFHMRYSHVCESI